MDKHTETKRARADIFFSAQPWRNCVRANYTCHTNATQKNKKGLPIQIRTGDLGIAGDFYSPPLYQLSYGEFYGDMSYVWNRCQQDNVPGTRATQPRYGSCCRIGAARGGVARGGGVRSAAGAADPPVYTLKLYQPDRKGIGVQ